MSSFWVSRIPIKLRVKVSGSPNVSLLRVSQQIHHEALPVLYDINTVVASRNDLCTKTDRSLKTPVCGQYIRQLLLAKCGKSIFCSFNQACDVCSDACPGLIHIFSKMLRLRAVMVDFTSQQAKFRRFQDAIDTASEFHHAAKRICTSVGSYALAHPHLKHVDVKFQHAPLARIRPAVIALSCSKGSIFEQSNSLTELQGIKLDVTNMLRRFVNHDTAFGLVDLRFCTPRRPSRGIARRTTRNDSRRAVRNAAFTHQSLLTAHQRTFKTHFILKN
ncbi:hypothetical protein M433DRAFT_509422 [Acidomyces richmondensis BFW]|nr:MAG: hypothetical protein FE78DRAFT_87786 [Acidomyces sp. 'richmondensis']KYG41014.1 hypothetical protein M433DRAFT_509422 [Acidomyces richmondensis BFW]